jgi:hypothetical protein
MLWIAVVALAGGCATTEGGPGGQGLDRQRQQARDHLARYDKTVLDAGGTQRFVPVGNLTGAEEALRQLAATGAGGCPECVPLEVIGARLTTARIQTTRGQATAPTWEYTLRGTAVRATRVAVATSAKVKVNPPSWDPHDAPAGLPIDAATTTTASRRLTVAFTGTPNAGSQACGADYSAEAVESAHAVVVIVVIVIEHPHAPVEACLAIGAPRTTTVDLEQPLGERAVLDVQQGLPVPLTITM